jgi:hypothetical protein
MQTNPSRDNTAPNDNLTNTDGAPRNFATISPSAYSLLLMKGLTSIPYARQAAELLIAPTPYNPDLDNRQPLFWARLMHFENRYWSINQLMAQLPITNILEISSGFSFRGLALSQEQPIFYIDTDLPELIATKQQFVTALIATDTNAAEDKAATKTDANTLAKPKLATDTNAVEPELAANPNAAGTNAVEPALSAASTNAAGDKAAANTNPVKPSVTAANTAANPNPVAPTPATPGAAASPNPGPAGHYSLAPLNALDTAAFDAIIDRFPPGPILILNEGLLVYLDEAEKTQLCSNIRNALQRRGGYWITADIYIQKDIDPALIDRQDHFSQFLQQHNVEEKKFRDFETAAEFFTNQGFTVDRESKTDVTKLTSWPHLLRTINPETQKKLFHSPKMHATWRLKIAE